MERLRDGPRHRDRARQGVERESHRARIPKQAQAPAQRRGPALAPGNQHQTEQRAGQDLLAGLKAEGGTAAFADRMLDHNQLWTLFENERWQALEKKFQN